MNLDTAKKQILELKNRSCHFIYRGSRNQVEEFDGMITKCYSSIFLVKTFDNTIKTYSYNDFIVKNLKIISCKQRY